MNGTYERAHVRSLEHSEEFWAEAAEQIDWFRPWDRVLDDTARRSTAGSSAAVLNTCYNALDRHVESGRAEQMALIYDSPVTGTIESFTYRELRDGSRRAPARWQRSASPRATA